MALACGVANPIGEAARWLMTRLAIYVAVAVGSGALFIAGAAIYAQFVTGSAG